MKVFDYLDNFSYLLKLLSCVLNDNMPPKPNANMDWASVFLLAKAHSVAGMVYCAIKKLPMEDLPPKEVLTDFKEYYEYQLMTDFNVDFETESILKEMASEKLYAMPLKGYILKHDYPIAAMRTMSDVDILYKESQKKQVKEFFINRGYKYEKRPDLEMDFTKDEFNHYEVQANLVSSERIAYKYFSSIWDRVSFSNEFIGKMELEDFYLYLLEHLAYHFEHGGVGVRMFMDVYVFQKAHKADLDKEYVSKILRELRLDDFARKAEQMSYNWFSGETEPDTYNDVTAFIVNSGTFGRAEFSIVGDTVKREEKSGKKATAFGNLLHKLFPSYSYIANQYPKIKKCKFIYPFMIPAYWFDRIFFKRNINTKHISKYFETTDSESAKTYKAVIRDMGLSKR